MLKVADFLASAHGKLNLWSLPPFLQGGGCCCPRVSCDHKGNPSSIWDQQAALWEKRPLCKLGLMKRALLPHCLSLLALKKPGLQLWQHSFKGGSAWHSICSVVEMQLGGPLCDELVNV